ncbi:MAG: hypothetical protein K0R82_1246 [Flavipsychrobacter sp.]|jgi:hypothetical protein|nr:hypothetical protein [Flavipsychrobacter sp.]
MKPILYTTLLLAVSASALAQPTITTMENHTIGTTVKYARDTINFPAPGNAGVNQTWNFTSLVPNDTITERVVAPLSTSFGANFPDASYVRISNKGSYTYIQKTASENYMAGMVDSASGTITKYYDKTVYSQTPLTYLKSMNDSYTSLIAASTDTSKGSVQAVADGWGTLVVPSGTFNNTIRVKLLIHQVDSIQAGPMKIPGILDATVYLWYDNQHYSPIMRWDSTHYDYTFGQIVTTSINYLVSETYPVSVKDVVNNKLSRAFIGGAKLIVDGNFEYGLHTVSLFNLSGQKIQSAELMGGSRLEMPVYTDLQTGMYLATIQEPNGNIETLRVIKQ